MQKIKTKDIRHPGVLASFKRGFYKLGIPLLLSASLVNYSGCATTSLNQKEPKRGLSLNEKSVGLFCDCYRDEIKKAEGVECSKYSCMAYAVGFDLPDFPMDPHIINFCVSKLSKPKDMNLSSASKISDKK